MGGAVMLPFEARKSAAITCRTERLLGAARHKIWVKLELLTGLCYVSAMRKPRASKAVDPDEFCQAMAKSIEEGFLQDMGNGEVKLTDKGQN